MAEKVRRLWRRFRARYWTCFHCGRLVFARQARCAYHATVRYRVLQGIIVREEDCR